MIRTREDLQLANRIVIKAGTSVVSTPDGYASLPRMATIVERAARLVLMGKQVLIVTSGAVGVGRQRLAKQAILHRSMSDLLAQRESLSLSSLGIANSKGYNSACAAAGQLGLMSLYESMFNQFDITVSQLLVTSYDFASPERRRNIQHVINQLLSLNIVPLINENDAVSANQGYKTYDSAFSDNDSLASLVAVEMSAQLLVLLTDVNGVYDRPPSEPNAKVISVFDETTAFQEGDKSLRGRGGMGAKVDAALSATKGGVHAVIIASGHESHIIHSIFEGHDVGTLFIHNAKKLDEHITHSLQAQSFDEVQSIVATNTSSMSVEQVAEAARHASRVLAAQSAETRSHILSRMAELLMEQQTMILEANALDLTNAEKSGLSGPMLKRLKLTSEKIVSLCDGIRSLAVSTDPINHLQQRTEIMDDLVLEKVSTPIGVLLIIFESRPDCLPQIAALAIRSGNALICKGGKEAEHTNQCLLQLIQQAIQSVQEDGQVQVPKEVVNLVSGREDVLQLLRLDKLIDLVIPRGSNSLVAHIHANTKIPVLGHADGVCHVYIDSSADLSTSERILLDAKVDYPAACNAVETLLIHENFVNDGRADLLLRSIRKAGITMYGGPRALAKGLTENRLINNDFHVEYSDLKLTIEIVSSVEDAVKHINNYGSHHTETIVAETDEVVQYFIQYVDSACVFHNASTRFADGFRFGLGAEVGISTGKIHARGPVGVEGLMTSKWILKSIKSTDSNTRHGHVVASNAATAVMYIEDGEPLKYTHKKLDC